MNKILILFITIITTTRLYAVDSISIVGFEDSVWGLDDTWVDVLESEFSSLSAFYDVKAKKDIGWANYEAYEFYEDDYDADAIKELKGMVDYIAVGRIIELEDGYNLIVKIISTVDASQISESITITKQSHVMESIEYLVKSIAYGDSYIPMKTAGFVGLGLSGLSLGLGITMHILGNSAYQESIVLHQEYESATSDFQAKWDAYTTKYNEHTTYMTTAVIGYAVSGVSLALGAYWVLHKKKAQEPRFVLMALPNYVAFSYRF